MGVCLPTRKLTGRCCGTFLESLLTPVLLLWSCGAQYGVILMDIVGCISPRDISNSSSSDSFDSSETSFSSSNTSIAAVTGTSSSAGTNDISYFWGRKPVLCSVLLSVLYGLFFLMSIIHYLRTLLVDNCPEAHPCNEEAANDSDESVNSRILSDSDGGSKIEEKPFQRCPKCNGIKPERCHHCSQCRKCCLKMDHHCPWMGNCIGFYNYKFFVNFLLWTSLLCIFVTIEAIPYYALFFSSGWAEVVSFYSVVHISILGLFAVGMLLSAGMLLYSHIFFVLHNTTTLESSGIGCGTPETCHGPYDLGRSKNWRQVFGDNPLLWFLPVFTSIGDGYHYPYSPNYHPRL